MKCEAWLSSAYPLNGQKLKCKTTHYKWKNGQYRIENASNVYAGLAFGDGPGTHTTSGPYGHISKYKVRYNKSNTTTDCYEVTAKPGVPICHNGETLHKILINGVTYTKQLI